MRGRGRGGPRGGDILVSVLMPSAARGTFLDAFWDKFKSSLPFVDIDGVSKVKE